MKLTLTITAQQFHAIYTALAGRVEDARILDPAEAANDLSLESIVEGFDTILARLADPSIPKSTLVVIEGQS